MSLSTEYANNCHRTGRISTPEKVYPPGGANIATPLQNETGVPLPGSAPIPGAPFPLETDSVEPLPESTRPRKDGPGGD